MAQALGRLFEKHRVVFWYDEKRELREAFEGLALPGVEAVEIANNEFGLKHRILRAEPGKKFLLYHHGPRPGDLDNWLLDVLLAHGEFRTDQVALWLAELELGLEFTELAATHVEFFHAAKRKEALKKLLQPDDTFSQVRLKMLATCVGTAARWDEVLEALLAELAQASDDGLAEGAGEKFRLVQRCKLDAWFWEQLKRQYGYASKTPSLQDFILTLFKDCYFQNFAPTPHPLSADALVFLKRWKDSRKHEDSFEQLSGACARVLGITQDLETRDFRTLLELDYFSLIDQKIISELVRAVVARTVSSGEVMQWVRQRRQGHWYNQYAHLYQSIEVGALFLEKLAVFNGQWGPVATENWSIGQWVQRYAEAWHLLDQLYRQFIFHVRKSGGATLMAQLQETVENLYTNQYLLPLGDRFSEVVAASPAWDAYPVKRQDAFFAHWVTPFLRKDNKVCVIISDALRYEVADELHTRVRKQKYLTAELEAMLGMVPSYTQLGMAALLPKQELALSGNDTGVVLADGQSTLGTTNRRKILSQKSGVRAWAGKADEIQAMKRDDLRALVRDHDVLYVYHNRIDATGDKRETEERVFEAADETVDGLLELINKLGSNKVNNMLVTADHGFLYQHRALEESDFAGVEPQGDEVFFRDRRFVLGRGLIPAAGLHHFTSAQLGLVGEVDVAVPRSINRLRLKGSGSRFVHGGVSLQEVVVPVLKINKGRQSDTGTVDVDIVRGSTSVITSGQLAVTLYQTGPVSDKVQPRVLRAGIYTQGGELISDSHTLTFDFASDNPRERELQVRFLLTNKADEANGQEVSLRLEEPVANTSHYTEYKALRYTIRRSFTSDFDF